MPFDRFNELNTLLIRTHPVFFWADQGSYLSKPLKKISTPSKTLAPLNKLTTSLIITQTTKVLAAIIMRCDQYRFRPSIWV